MILLMPEDEDKDEDDDDVSPQQIDVPEMGSDFESKSTNFVNPQIIKGPPIRIQKDHPIENVTLNLNE